MSTAKYSRSSVGLIAALRSNHCAAIGVILQTVGALL